VDWWAAERLEHDSLRQRLPTRPGLRMPAGLVAGKVRA
jgi:hypothetical protein